MNAELIMWLRYVGPLFLGIVGIIIQQSRTIAAIGKLGEDLNVVKLRTSKVEVRVDNLEDALIAR